MFCILFHIIVCVMHAILRFSGTRRRVGSLSLVGFHQVIIEGRYYLTHFYFIYKVIRLMSFSYLLTGHKTKPHNVDCYGKLSNSFLDFVQNACIFVHAHLASIFHQPNKKLFLIISFNVLFFYFVQGGLQSIHLAGILLAKKVELEWLLSLCSREVLFGFSWFLVQIIAPFFLTFIFFNFFSLVQISMAKL